MKSIGGSGLVIIGFLFLYLAITGRLDCFFQFIACVTGQTDPGVSGGASSTAPSGSGTGGINWGSLINTGVDILGQRRPVVVGSPKPKSTGTI